MNVYEQVMRDMRAKLFPVVPYCSPQWLRGVPATMPLPYIQRECGRMGRALVSESIAAERFRATRAFTGAA